MAEILEVIQVLRMIKQYLLFIRSLKNQISVTTIGKATVSYSLSQLAKELNGLRLD